MIISKTESEYLNRFKKNILAAFPDRIQEVFLFGSKATGRAGKHSDYDVFIRVDKRDRALVDAIFDLAYDIYMESDQTVDISPLVMSKDFFETRLSQERRIAADIVEQGIPL